ncbi:MAG: MAPEG family protein [Candidatus Pelagadaptatus aseana]|uniref:MAPEG family protein n=1 Tax=Candidatus Pelagadaptatus aseana TaxID=3120508 RepID=UPI0039B23CED
MSSHQIFWPMLLQIILPNIVLLVMAKRKGADRKAGTVDLKKSALDNTAWSEGVVLTSNNLANQFQMPVLFYALCLMAYSLNLVSDLLIYVAWFFVVTRYAHAYVHVGSNYIPHRFPLFLVGVVALWVMIGNLAWKLAGL